MLWAEPLSHQDEILAPGCPRAPFCPSSLRMGHLPVDTQGKAPHFRAHQLRLWEAGRKNRQLPIQQWQWGRGWGASQENLTWGWADSLLDSTSRSTGREAKVPQCLMTCPGSHTARQPQGPVHPHGNCPCRHLACIMSLLSGRL